jgi:uncharacterized RDD family membrane protein YckC
MASADYRVVTPERVTLQYDVAGMGSRGAAMIVDLMVQAVIAFVLYLALLGALLIGAVSSAIGSRSADTSTPFFIALAVFFVALFVLTFGYNMIFEIIWNGQTPGKRTVGIRVIRENGYPLRSVDSVIRNIVRIVDYLPFIYAVGLFTMLFNSRSKRLGDFAAGTIVVREASGSADLLTANLTASEPAAADANAEVPRGPRLSAEDETLVRDFLMRRASLAPEARADLARRLYDLLRDRYGLAADPERDPEAAFARLV